MEMCKFRNYGCMLTLLIIFTVFVFTQVDKLKKHNETQNLGSKKNNEYFFCCKFFEKHCMNKIVRVYFTGVGE